MTRLDEFAANTYSQFGEDGIIAHIFEKIGEDSRVAVEFGAGDGLSCSNTARLWRDQGWTAYLIEPDAGRYDALLSNTAEHDAHCQRGFVRPRGPESITERLRDWNVHVVDFMSIDIDGDDYFILETLACRPRVISIEFNPTVPPHLDMRQNNPGETFGASLLSIVRLAATIGYTFIGASRCNAFLLDATQLNPFMEYDTDPSSLFSPSEYTYAVSDYNGQVVLCGQALPWGAKYPYVFPLTASGYVSPVTNDPQFIRRGFEARWGPAMWLTAHDLAADTLVSLLTVDAPPLVCLDLTLGTLNALDWMNVGAAANYRALLVGPVVALVKNT